MCSKHIYWKVLGVESVQHLHSVHVKSIQVPVLILLVTLCVVDLILFIRGGQ